MKKIIFLFSFSFFFFSFFGGELFSVLCKIVCSWSADERRPRGLSPHPLQTPIPPHIQPTGMTMMAMVVIVMMVMVVMIVLAAMVIVKMMMLLTVIRKKWGITTKKIRLSSDIKEKYENSSLTNLQQNRTRINMIAIKLRAIHSTTSLLKRIKFMTILGLMPNTMRLIQTKMKVIYRYTHSQILNRVPKVLTCFGYLLTF